MQFYATCTRQPARGYLPGCTRAVHTLHVRDLVQFCQTLKTGLLGKQNRKRTTKIEEENRNDKEKPFLELVAYCRFSPGISRPEARIQPICCLSMDYSYTVSSLCSRHENGQLSFLNLYKIRYRAKFQFFFFAYPEPRLTFSYEVRTSPLNRHFLRRGSLFLGEKRRRSYNRSKDKKITAKCQLQTSTDPLVSFSSMLSISVT